MNRSTRARRLSAVLALAGAGGWASVAGCGSRTGLLGEAVAGGGFVGDAGAGESEDATGIADAPSPPPPHEEAGAIDGGGVVVAIAADSTSVYWLVENDSLPTDASVWEAMAVMKRPLGGTPLTLVAGDYVPVAITVDATSVYWAATWTNDYPNYATDGLILKVPLGGGTPITLASELDSDPQCIAVNANSVYWMTTQSTVMSVPLGGGTPTTLATGQLTCGNGVGLAVDSTDLYWTTGEQGSVMTMPIGGGAATTLFYDWWSDNGGIAVDGTSVYWANGSAGALMSVPVHGGTPTTVASSQYTPSGVAIDSASIYWTDPWSGAVARAPLSGGTVTTLAFGVPWAEPGTYAIASGGGYVYWTNGSSVIGTPK
jgi:hypothetical protein